MAKIEIAKQSGIWDIPDQPHIHFEMPEEFEKASKNNQKAQKFINTLTKTDLKQYITWIATAKRPETRENVSKRRSNFLKQVKNWDYDDINIEQHPIK